MSLDEEYRSWLLSYDQDICKVERVDQDHVRLLGEGVTGEVAFYRFEGEPEIVEMRIWREGCEDQNLFFLHFELDDLVRAQDLFKEMLEAFGRQLKQSVSKVLLCCTSGMTTTLFAAKMGEAAKTLSLGFEFEALPLEQAIAHGEDYVAILLAPQVGYRRHEVADAYPDKVVLEIPAKIFGSYDAGAAIRLLLSALETYARGARPEAPEVIERDLSNDKKILVISSVHRINSARIGYRIYDHGKKVLSGRVYKYRLDIRDVEDVAASVRMSGVHMHELDAISVAVPGVVDEGSLIMTGDGAFSSYDIKSRFEERYGVPVFVENNANAAAVGCYVAEDDYENIVLYTQRTGHPVPGQGTIVRGQLVRGRSGAAGEMRFVGPYFSNWEDRLSSCWTQEGMTELVAAYLLCNICVTAPEAVFVAVQLVPDMELLKQKLLKTLPEELVPDLIHVDNYHERIMIGGLALALRGLRAQAAQEA
ncbi:MAG: ROK family protein [Atopobiaceae bacterium]|nr:ROK family protein [Atopobiaceae bacterium]